MRYILLAPIIVTSVFALGLKERRNMCDKEKMALL